MALLFALVAPIIFVVLGFSIDYGYASYINQRIARACDDATLASVSQNAATTVGGYTNTSGLQNIGNQYFANNVSDLNLANLSFNLNVAYTLTNNTVTASATYSYAVPTFFARLLGMSSIPVSGQISASARPPVYINYYLVVDVSNSMGIGATQADMTNLYNALVAINKPNNDPFKQDNEFGCAFACHTADTRKHATETTEQTARRIGVTLRIDSAVSALQSLFSTAASVAGTTKNINFAIFLMQDNPDTGKQIVRLWPDPNDTTTTMSNDYATLSAKAATIDLGTNSKSWGDTDLNTGLATMQNQFVPPNGVGTSTTSPLNYVFLITDGLWDQITTKIDSKYTGPIDPNWCAGLKAKATVGIIYTTYLEIWSNNDPSTNKYEKLYDSAVKPYKNQSSDQIEPNLAACASSSDFFFEAKDGPSITTAMQQLFARSQPVGGRLTQ